MCIITNLAMLDIECAKTNQLMLWKVIGKNNLHGVWNFIQCQCEGRKFHPGKNTAQKYFDGGKKRGEFHCFFTRKMARQYLLYCNDWLYQRENLKIIKVYADRKDIVDAGVHNDVGLPCISVSQMKIKSLKHQR